MRRALAAALTALALGCSSADESPLGGPYGGTTPSAPSAGSTGAGDAVDASVSDPPRGTADAGGTVSTPKPEAGSNAGTPPITTDAGTVVDGGGGSQPVVDAAQPPAITWSQIFTLYLANGTIGDCPSCHSEMSDAKASYSWLQLKSSLDSLNDPDTSVLSWYGGDMPKHGPTSEPQATTDINAWAAAGYLDN